MSPVAYLRASHVFPMHILQTQSAAFSPCGALSKLCETRPEFLQTRLRLVLMLEADHEIIRMAHDNHFTFTAFPPPIIHPSIEDMVEMNV